MKLFICVIVLASLVNVDSLVCRDDAGNNVDWWVSYKLPRRVVDQNDRGNHYTIITSNDSNRRVWKLSSSTMDDTSNMFYRTVEPLYGKSGAEYVFYNDQHPLKSSSSRAHAKGVAASDSESGFWIVHSIPNYFPDLRKNYTYPDNGRENGHISLCLSLSAKEMIKVAGHLSTLGANVYQESGGSLFGAVNSRDQTTSPVVSSKIKTLGGLTLHHLAKQSRHHYEIFAAISSLFKSNLRVQSWKRGLGGAQKSNCDRKNHYVQNILAMQIRYESNNVETVSSSWPTTKDSSKWIVSDNQQHPVVCIGDLNRMGSQLERGGGYLCFENPEIWDAFNNVVLEVEQCEN